MKTILLSILFIAVVSIGFQFGFWWGLLALCVSYVVARACEKKVKNGN